jgi:hypothetical protein
MPTSVPCICPIVASPWPRPITTLFGVARLAAIKAVKQQMKDAGLKPAWIEMKVITAAADAYLDQHRDELLDEAAERIARWPPLRKIAEQEVRRRTKAIQKTSLQQQAKSSTVTRARLAQQAHTAIDRLSNRHST